jgi:hypothetical protein
VDEISFCVSFLQINLLSVIFVVLKLNSTCVASPVESVWLSIRRSIKYHHHHHHVSVMELGHLFTVSVNSLLYTSGRKRSLFLKCQYVTGLQNSGGVLSRTYLSGTTLENFLKSFTGGRIDTETF